jgi:hypothetical protein
MTLLINKGQCYNFLKREDYKPTKLKALVNELNDVSDFVRLEKKNPILRKLLFTLYGFPYVSYEEMYVDCWPLLEEKEQIPKLQALTLLLGLKSSREKAIINLFANKMNNGSCAVLELNKFLFQHNVPMISQLDPIYISEESKQATLTIYNYIFHI